MQQLCSTWQYTGLASIVYEDATCAPVLSTCQNKAMKGCDERVFARESAQTVILVQRTRASKHGVLLCAAEQVLAVVSTLPVCFLLSTQGIPCFPHAKTKQ